MVAYESSNYKINLKNVFWYTNGKPQANMKTEKI